MTWVYEYGTNDRGVLKNRKVRLHIWDSLVKATNLTRYYKERASLKGDEEIRDFQGSLIDYLYVMKNQKYYDTEVTWAIAANYFELGNYFEAIKYYNEVIGHKLNLKMDRFVIEKLMRLYTAKGDCKMNLQDYRGGIEDYQNALNYCLSLNEKNNIYILLLYSNIGKAKILINEYESAKIELLKAIEFEGVVYNIVNKEVVKNFDLAYAYYLLGAANYKMYEGNSIRSYKEDACLAWSKAGDLGNKEAYTNIKDYCNN
jgi:tetratricopeptide (TPR) repeat protein